MNIAFIIEHFNKQQGGAEQYAWGLARGLVTQGHHLDIITFSAPAHPDFDCHVTALDIKQAQGTSRQERMANAIKATLKDREYDLVQGFNHLWPCDILRLGGGVHLAFEQYNLLSVPHPVARAFKQFSVKIQPKYRALRFNEAHQFDDPHRQFIAISQRVADDMRHHYPHVAERIHLIRNAVDPARFNPALLQEKRKTTRTHLKIDDETKVLLFMSNNYRLKGLHDLLDALPDVIKATSKPVQLLVVGRGDIRAYGKQIHRLGLKNNVQFIGSVSDPLDYYAVADALIHPSYYDAYGFVGLEAMACGLPVVISRNCGVSEIMQHEQGSILIDMPGPVSTLVSAITRVLDPVFREAARTTNRKIAEQYPLEDNYRQIAALYQQFKHS